MGLFQREIDETEKLFRLFTSDLETKEFDLKVFDKRQIKKHLGRGMYERWEESLGILRYRKIIMIFDEKELEVSWPSYDYLDRLTVNLARAPDQEVLLKAEKELLGLLELEEKVS